jgi:Zn-finger nucleic acid-binding protein
MVRTLTSDGSGVVVDVCKPHGTFFDAGELHRIIEYAQGQLRDPRYRPPELSSSTPMPRQERDDDPPGEDPTDTFKVVLTVGAIAGWILLTALTKL